RYDPTRNPVAARRARDGVLRQLGQRGIFPDRAIADALEQPLPETLAPLPFRAPHLARHVFARLPPGVPEVTTTLDLRLQSIAESKVRAHVDELRRQGIRNAAVVVLENRGRAMRVLVGSADFFDVAADGQVNNALARRSPGSTLKPFVYAQAIDAGILVPDSWLLDIPTDFSGYVAENYDGEYRGRVLARDALRLSLNASAVRLLSRLGLERFHGLLVRAGVLGDNRPALDYGLPLILGAGEVRLLDLTNLYATLAEGGVHRPVRLLADAAASGRDAIRMFSREAAALVTQVLTEVERPDLPQAWGLTRDVPAVAWKTGTSFGHRDAWAVGFSRRYTIGVWVGNPDGRGQEGISGARHAGPLLFDLFRALEPGASPVAATDPRLRLATTRVCAVSHDLPGSFCPATTRITTVPGRSRLQTCELHRRVFVDAEDGTLLAGDCLAERPHRPDVLTVFPAELVAWWQATGRTGMASLPPLSHRCRQVPGTDPPRIVSPDAATPYLIRRDAPLEHQRIPLEARTASGTTRLYWYQDGTLVASGAPGERRHLAPEAGTHRLVVVDSAGRADAVTFSVR
ncbi:MAG: penicillin-binding transpeptidase domain-containing protein, partial [Thermoanaerobaculia bacterium]